MNIGINFSVIGEKQGEYFVQATRNYIPYAKKSGYQYNGLNAFVTTRLGNAFIRLSYENIFDRGSYFVPVYPQLDRNFRLSVSMSFFD